MSVREHSLRRRPSRVLWWGHLGLIGAVAAYALVSAVVFATPDVNFGLVIASFGSMLLGLPWSLLVFLVPSDVLLMQDLALAGGVATVLNLCLHLMIRRRLARQWQVQ